MRSKIVILITLYNKEEEKSKTLNALKDHKKILQTSNDYKIILRDNSSKPMLTNNALDGWGSVEYWHDGINLSLSTIYNKTTFNHSFDYFINLDDDSYFDRSYARYVSELQPTNESLAIFPRVVSNGMVVSPGNYILTKGFRRFKFQGSSVNHRSIMAITSGMILSKKLTTSIKYNENLSFYGIDTDFVLRLRKNKNHRILVEDIGLIHESALKSNSSDSKVRLKNRIFAWRNIHKHGLERIVVELRIIILKLLRKVDD